MPTSRLRPRLAILALALLLSAVACYTDPQDQLDQAQQMIDLADILNEVSVRTAEIEFTVDSLRRVVAAQDSTIVRLANLAGVSYRPR
jgi:hypothetical protein